MGKGNNSKINKSIFILLILILGIVSLVIYFSSKTDNSSVQSSNLESLEKSSVYKNDKFKFTLNLASNLDSVLQTEDDKYAIYLLYDKKFSADLKNKSDINPLLELTEKNADIIYFDINKNDFVSEFVSESEFDIKKLLTTSDDDKIISWEEIKTDNGLLVYIYSRELTSGGPGNDQNFKEFGATWIANGVWFKLKSDSTDIDIDTIKNIAITFSETK